MKFTITLEKGVPFWFIIGTDIFLNIETNSQFEIDTDKYDSTTLDCIYKSLMYSEIYSASTDDFKKFITNRTSTATASSVPVEKSPATSEQLDKLKIDSIIKEATSVLSKNVIELGLFIGDSKDSADEALPGCNDMQLLESMLAIEKSSKKPRNKAITLITNRLKYLSKNSIGVDSDSFEIEETEYAKIAFDSLNNTIQTIGLTSEE